MSHNNNNKYVVERVIPLMHAGQYKLLEKVRYLNLY